jgi:hypothetical protein
MWWAGRPIPVRVGLPCLMLAAAEVWQLARFGIVPV